MKRHLPQRFIVTNYFRFMLVIVAATCLVAVFVTNKGQAATPASGKVTTANTPANPLRYTAGPFNVPNVTGFAGALQCTAATPATTTRSTLTCPTISLIRIRCASRCRGERDGRLRLSRLSRNADGTAGAEALSIGSSADPEVGVLPAVKRNYIVRVVPFAPLGQSVGVAISVEPKAGRFNQGAGTSPRYANYAATNGLGTDSGEPTLGANWKTDKVMFIAGLETLRVSFNDATSPATATWEDKSFLLTSLATLDPILYTDNRTGRTIISQLAGTNSLSALTDDDGETWIPNEGGPLTSGVDHQTIGGGPSRALTGGKEVYPERRYIVRRIGHGLLRPLRRRRLDWPDIRCTRDLRRHPRPREGWSRPPRLHAERQCNSNQGVIVSKTTASRGRCARGRPRPTTSTYDSITGRWDPRLARAGGTVYFG